MNIKTILNNKDAVSLLMLGQINFQAGLSMMQKLREDEKARAHRTEDAARNDTSVADEFAEYCPEVKKAPALDLSANLVVSSLLLASEIQGDNLEFLKRNIRTPRQIIEGQMDWMANQEAQARLVTATKFGLTVAVDKFLEQIKGQQHNKTVSYITEAQSAIKAGIKQMDTRHLQHLIEESYDYKEWKAKLEDSAISLYEGAVKRIEAGKFADLPDEVVTFAQEALKQRTK